MQFKPLQEEKVNIIPKLRILYGPPGTGKTWLAAREAVDTVEPESYAQWRRGDLLDDELLKLHNQLVLEGRIKWVTFHPSYSYEDFVEGFRPIRGVGGEKISFEVCKGPFRNICDIAAGNPNFFGPPAGINIEAIGGKKNYNVISANDQGWLLLVCPNRTDQVGEKQQKFVTRSIIEKSIELKLDPKVFSIPGSGYVIPSDYGLSGDEKVLGSELRRKVAELLCISSSDLANSAHFGAVANFYKGQSVPKPKRACLVIDEINRADLSRVFGELITLLEPDKRIGATEERRVHLPYSGEERFGVPGTLSVIGTMNTADKSISTMDFAMRRRFAFTEVAPNPNLCPNAYGGADVSAVLAGVNRRIEVLRGRDYRLGHAAFMEHSLEKIRNQFEWNGNDSKIRAIAYIFRSHVFPLLREYFYEDFRKIEIVLNTINKEFGSSKRLFFDAQHLTADEQERFSEVFNADGAILGQPASWWDAESSDQFDADAFLDALKLMA
jgi:5-methylcytosine-specific restriction protein B